MATVERTYNIPLRKEFQKAPKYKRAKKAVTAVREYLQKHMKTQDVRLGVKLNMELWKDGIKNPPHHLKVTAFKDDEGICKAELFGHKFIEKKVAAPKKKKARGLAGKLAEKVEAVKDAKKEEKAETKEAKEEVKAPEPKVEEKKPEPGADTPKPEAKPEEKKEEAKVEETKKDKPSEPQKQVTEKKE